MKEIDSQLYGYSYELDTASESDGTKCFAVDTGTVFVAYKGVWYEQPGSFWAASISEGEDDLFGTSWEIGKIVPDDDLLVLNVVDTGKRYVSFNGKWYEQPVAWSAPAAGGGGGGGSELPAVTSDDNDKVLTVVSGAWAKSTNQATVVKATVTESSQTLNKTWREIFYGGYAVIEAVVPFRDNYKAYQYITSVKFDEMSDAYVVTAIDLGYSSELTFTTSSPTGYPTYAIPGG